MIPLLIAALSLPFTASGNFSFNLYGTADKRPQTWGYTDSQEVPITFSPPPGLRVHVTRIRGDLVAWLLSSANSSTPPRYGTSTGLLVAFHDSGPEGSARCDWCAENTRVYVQDALTPTQPKSRAPFDVDLNWTLPPDNKLIVKAASFLNNTGQKIHAEVTFTLTFDFKEPL